MEGINDTLICLIPKEEVPRNMSQFQPISLYNVIVKTVYKIIANKLKPFMIQLTEKYQSSFILGRSMIDNVIVAQELVHFLSKLKGSIGSFVLNVDLEKAYDRVDWSFLREVLKITEFKAEYCNIIVDCVTLASLSICYNSERFQPFKPSRGLCQGGPLSPYLFVLCMKVLS